MLKVNFRKNTAEWKESVYIVLVSYFGHPDHNDEIILNIWLMRIIIISSQTEVYQ